MPSDDQELYKQNQPWLDFFLRHWLRPQPSQRMAYLEGWQQNPHDPSYDVALRYLTRAGVNPAAVGPDQAIQWEDVGPAGARWHGSSRTPGGQDLKAPWHPSSRHEDIMLLRQKFFDALKLLQGE